jgi:type II secretory pathway pseudopilin PulG
MELLVVIGIIIIMTAMSIPAVKKFMDGQRLSQSGRILQSAFNEARRAAITQRTRQYLVFYRETDANQQLLYGVVRYRERFGYEGDAHKLLPHVEVDMSTTYPANDLRAGLATGLNVTVFNGIPPQNEPTYFQGILLRPNLAAAGWIQFNRDGTISLAAPLNPNLPPPGSAASSVFDLNNMLNTPVPDSTATQVDLNLRETGNTSVDKRCFVDIDPNTGRLRFRVVQCAASS